MAGKNVKPAAKGTGGQGAATKPKGAASKVAAVDQLKEKDQLAQLGNQAQTGNQQIGNQEQLDSQEQAGSQAQTGNQEQIAGNDKMGIRVEGNHVLVELAVLNASLGRPAPTGSQAQPGTPTVDSGADSASAQPGAEPSSSGSSSRESIPGLAVSSSRDGFWRGGRQWTKAEQIVRLSELTDEQADQVINEPMLTVAFVDAVAQAEEGA